IRSYPAFRDLAVGPSGAKVEGSNPTVRTRPLSSASGPVPRPPSSASGPVPRVAVPSSADRMPPPSQDDRASVHIDIEDNSPQSVESLKWIVVLFAVAAVTAVIAFYWFPAM